MNKKSLIKKSILFIIFFLLTIGNGEYVINKFGNNVEYIGLILLMVCSVCKLRMDKETLKKDLKIIILSLALSYGAFYNNISNEAKIMIFLSSLLLMNYSKFSETFVSENKQIKVIGNAIFFGMIINSIIGVVTGTLGLYFNSNEAIFKVLFLGGLKIKNYCGGIWLIVYISYFIYYYRNGRLKNHVIRFILLGILILLSGSKGACFLAIVFTLVMNFKSILKFKENQEKIFYTFLCIIIIFSAIYVYNNILINIPTYLYRIRGMQKLFNLLTKSFSQFMFGISNIAYANTGYDYTINMRNFLGWDASVEMAYVNIMIKNGFIGYLVYFIIFKDILKNSKMISKKEKNIVLCILIVMLLSGFTETYIASIHYVVGPALFCLINGVICKDEFKEEK